MAYIKKITGKRLDERGRPRVSYRVRYRDQREDTKTQTFRLLRDAETFAREVELQKTRGTYLDPEGGKQTVRECVERYLEQRWESWSDSTRHEYRLMSEKVIFPALGDRQISSLRVSDIRAFVDSMGDREAYRERAMKPLRGALDQAVEDDRIRRNPTRALARTARRSAPTQETDERVFLTADEVRQIADAIDPRYRALVLLSGFLGPRISEVAGLNIGDLDLKRATLRIERSYSVTAGKAIMGPTKSRRSRTLDLPEFIVAALVEHLAKFVPDPFDADAPLFTFERGGARIRRDAFGARFRRVVDQLEMDPRPRVHDLRHSAVSILHSVGVEVTRIAKIVGHQNAGITLKVYLHVFDEDAKKDVAKLDRLFSTA